MIAILITFFNYVSYCMRSKSSLTTTTPPENGRNKLWLIIMNYIWFSNVCGGAPLKNLNTCTGIHIWYPKLYGHC